MDDLIAHVLRIRNEFAQNGNYSDYGDELTFDAYDAEGISALLDDAYDLILELQEGS